MRVILYGRMTELPLADRGTPTTLRDTILFVTPDGRTGVAPRAGCSAPALEVSLSPVEVGLLKAGWLWHPAIEDMDEDGRLFFNWRHVPLGSQLLEAYP